MLSPPPPPIDCTMASAQREMTVSARTKDMETCIFLTRAMEVTLNVSLNVTTTVWHYRGATLSCRLQYKRSRYWVVVYNSRLACHYFRLVGFHPLTP
jgi:hypothetical protein